MASLLNMSGGSLLKKVSLLPSGYKQLEYIESTTGYEYIDTGYMLTIDSEIETTFQNLYNTYDDRAYTFAIDGGDTYISRWATGPSYAIKFGNGENITTRSANDYIIDLQIHTAILNKRRVSVSNVFNFVANANSIGNVKSLIIGYNNRLSYTVTPKCRYFSFIVRENGIISLNLIPCKNPNNIVGMYDTVNGVFYSSPNGTAFVAGPEV